MFERYRNGGAVQMEDLAEFHPSIMAWSHETGLDPLPRWFGMAAAFVVLQAVFPNVSIRRTHKDLVAALSQANRTLQPADAVPIPSFRRFLGISIDFRAHHGVMEAMRNDELMFIEHSAVGECRKSLHAQGLRDPELSLLLGTIVVAHSESTSDTRFGGGVN